MRFGLRRNFGFLKNLSKPKTWLRSKSRSKSARSRKHNSWFDKHPDNPIILPRPTNGWEAWQVFNPAAILLEGKVHFLYRAIGEDGMSRLGYARSEDGYKIFDRLDYPVYEHFSGSNNYSVVSIDSGGSWSGCEDPRIVRVDDGDTLYMTYTACDNGLRVALTSIKVDDFLKKKWKWKKPMLISKPGEVHKNWVVFPEKINGKYAVLHSISPKILVEYTDNLEFEQDECIESHYDGGRRKGDCWDNWVRGAGPPPIKTKHGWLLFYHAMDNKDPNKYKLGAMLLAINNPSHIIARSSEPVLEPSEEYEFNGYKGGVVYCIGAVVKDGELLVYYGSSDNYVCVAKANFDKFVDDLRNSNKPKLLRMLLKKKH